MRILLAEDQKDLNELLSRRLKAENYTVDSCYDGEAVLDYMDCAQYDALILDIMMPKKDGLEVLKILRSRNDHIPVLLLTAKDSIEDRVRGLDAGADDYLVKPFAFEELMARIRSILRRPRKLSDSSALLFGDLAFSTNELSLTGPSGSCTLSGREAALLETFLRNPGQTLSRELLLTKVWGMDSDVEDGNLDNYIHFLRRRLKNLNSSVHLQTVRGVGYRLER